MTKFLPVLAVIAMTMNTANSHEIAPKENSYKCEVFEPDDTGGNHTPYIVSEKDRTKTHHLNDKIHTLEIKWWSWTLNLGLHEIGKIPEITGGATTNNLKLRFHNPDLSVECSVIEEMSTEDN